MNGQDAKIIKRQAKSEQDTCFHFSCQVSGMLNGYLVSANNIPFVVQVEDSSSEEFEKVLDSLRSAFIKSQNKLI